MSVNIYDASHSKLVNIAGSSESTITKATYDESPALYAHSVGDIIYFNEYFYKVVSAISVGDTITVGTNVESAGLNQDTAVYIENIPGGGGQQTAIIALSATTASVDNATSTATITMTTNSDGTPSVSSSDSSIATASINNNTITITGVGRGTATITVSIPATSSYTAAEATIAVTSEVFELVIGNTYFFGGFYWTAAEDLGDNAVCLQSQGMTAGTWPGYKLASDYSGTKNYGNANTAYNSNIDGDNIANYDDVTSTWYTKYKNVEKTGQAYGSGLFLVSNAKCNNTEPGQQGSGNYWDGLKKAGANVDSFGGSGLAAWNGSVYGSTYAWYVDRSGSMNATAQTSIPVLAPAFNLDLTKVKLVDGDHIMLPTEEMPTLKTFATATDAEIAAMVQASEKGIIDLYEDAGWRVGQEHQTSLSAIAASGTYDGVSWSVGESQDAQSGTLVLMHHKPVSTTDANAYKLVTATECGRKIPSFAIGLKNSMETIGYMNATNTNVGSWEATARRNWCNGGFREALNSTLRNIFKKFYCVTGDSNSTATGAANKVTEDYFALAAGKEVLGGGSSVSVSTDNEANALIQFTLYETSANRIKKLGDSGSANYWRERSPFYYNATTYCLVNGSGNADSSVASTAYGISPFGMIP